MSTGIARARIPSTRISGGIALRKDQNPRLTFWGLHVRGTGFSADFECQDKERIQGPTHHVLYVPYVNIWQLRAVWGQHRKWKF